ncbi:MBL fold metallo-hydrolase [Halomonas ramblicola]|uniref:MBL fold metallo-hydrolase n=1 Tax=Halomonas ramblicola TaxID=747349 RepID=UPI0025B5BAE5|nr:MBL fold metallo-hydrolase [Halomonas ramblicola]MDN3522923.1 MBL fold metallo-hydrolase [Halomonas ramblicola]
MRLRALLSSRLLPLATTSLVTLALSTGHVAAAGDQSSTTAPADRVSADDLSAPTRVVTLGTGTPDIVEGRSGTSTAVIVDREQVYLFDAGAGFMEVLGKFGDDGGGIFPDTSKYPGTVLPTYLDKLFLTHLDSDHILGIPELLLRGWVLERNHPVRIWGPPGTRTVAEGAIEAYQPDIRHRLGSLPIGKEAPYTGIVEELASEPGVVYRDRYVTITAFDVDHGTWEAGEAFGYRIEAPDMTIVISGDTRPTPNLIEHAQGADILLHEVMSTTGLATLPQEWQGYMLDAHTTTRQLADIAEEIDPELLVMIHPLFLGAPEDTLIQEMTDAYEGNFALANDGDVFE